MFSPTVTWILSPNKAFIPLSLSLFISWVWTSYSMNGRRLLIAVALASAWAFFFKRHNLQRRIILSVHSIPGTILRNAQMGIWFGGRLKKSQQTEGHSHIKIKTLWHWEVKRVSRRKGPSASPLLKSQGEGRNTQGSRESGSCWWPRQFQLFAACVCHCSRSHSNTKQPSAAWEKNYATQF